MKREKLVKARLSRGLEQAQVAQALSVSPITVSRWECGRATPYPVHIDGLCAYFNMSAHELDLDVVVSQSEQYEEPQQNAPNEQLPESLPTLSHRHVWYNDQQQRGFSYMDALVHRYLQTRGTHPSQRRISHLQARSTRVAPVNNISGLSLIMNTRRQALYQMVSSATAIFFFSPYALLPQESRERLALAQIHPSYLDDDALDDLSTITASYRSLYHKVPLDTLVDGIAAHLNTIVQYLKDSHPTPIYNRLCAIASETAQILGHTFHLINEYDLAHDYYTFALKVALDVGHTDLWAAGVGRTALLLIAWGKQEKALPLLKGAQDITIHDPRLGGWLSAVTANVYAKMDNENAYLRSMEQAKNVTVPHHLDNDIYWTGFTPSLVAGFEGGCLIHLRQPEPALKALEQSLALINPALRLLQCGSAANLGRVRAQLGDPKKACELLSQVLDVIIETRSMKDLLRVHEARAELQPWKNSADVRTLDDKLHLTVKALKQRTEDS